MRDILKDRRFIYPLVLAMFAGGLGVTAYLHQLDQQQQRAQARDRLLQAASLVRVGIEQQVNTSLNLAMGMVIYVATNPELTQAQFEVVADRLLGRASYVRNIGLSKDNVISHIYPLEGNRRALGFRLLDAPDQREAVLRVMQTRHSVIAGPVALVQGGTGFIGRIPVYLDKERTRYWGLASVVMNVDAFFRAAGLEQIGGDLDIALRGRDGLGAAGEVFYGDAALFDDPDAIRLPISFSQGSWQLAAAPRGGLYGDAARSTALITAGVLVSALLGAFVYFLLDAVDASSRAKRHAEEASAQKSRFFSQMTHELRTPLTAIQGAVGLLASGKLRLDAEQSRDLLQNAMRNCQRLQWIVNDMLDLKKLESGTAVMTREPLSVAALIMEAVDAIQPFARECGVAVHVGGRTGERVCIEGDRAWLHQVLINLLSNAIKYSPDDGRVTVNAVLADDVVRIEVIDQGEGVSESKLGAIFEEFSQDKPSSRAHIASTGLGLSISRQIVVQHGGRIGCRNLQPRGCCFFFELPHTTTSAAKVA